MNSRKLVLVQTGVVAAGQVICTAAMIGAFALLHKFDSTVLLGGIVGALVAVGNFFAMAMTAMIAADKAVKQDVKGGQALMRSSMIGRLVALAAILVIFGKSGYCNILALIIPQVFTRPILSVWEFFRKAGES